MALMILFLILFSLILMILNYKSKYSMLFMVMSLSIALCAVTLCVEIQRVSNYSVAQVGFLSVLDGRIFLGLNELLSVPPSTILLLRNVGYVSFQATNLAFIYLFGKYTKHDVPGRHSYKKPLLASLMAVLLLYFVFYHPEVGYGIFLASQRTNDFWGEVVVVLGRGVHASLGIFTYLCPLIPILYLILNYKNGYLTIFFEQLLGLILILLTLDALFFVVITEPLLVKWDELLRLGFWRGVSDKLILDINLDILPSVSLGLLVFIVFLLIRFQTISVIDYFKEYSIKKNLQILHDNLRDVLHSEKNVIFNFKILAEAAVHDYGTEQGQKKLERLIELSGSHLNSLTQSINNIKDFRINTIRRDFCEAIEGALGAYPLPEGITLVKNYRKGEVFCNYDLYHMTQVIINLLENAVDSLGNKAVGRIELKVEVSDYWALFSIKDNGSGISPKVIRKIQRPYFSTKSKQNNWGIGLFYVQKVVKAHLGYIRVWSLEGVGTEVELLFMKG